MACAQAITHVQNNATGLVTFTNPNSTAATVTVNPALTGFPLTVPANGTNTATFPVSTTVRTCYELMYDCD